MITDYLTFAIGALALAFVLVIILTHKRSEHIKEWLVGAAAGLDFAQIAHVHLFTIAVVFWLLTDWPIPQRKVSLATMGLLLSAAILGATSFVGPLTLDHTLTLQLMGLAATAAIVGVKATPESMRRMAYGLLTISLFSAYWAILQKFGFLPIRRFNSIEGTGRVMGIYREPDWLGLFCAIGIVTTLRLELSSLRKVAFLSTLSLALLFSLARASVIALGVVGVLAIIGNLLVKSDVVRHSRNRRALLALGGIMAVTLAFSPSLSSKLIARFETGFTNAQQDVGARARALQVQSLNSLAHNAPWYGDGFSASGRVQVAGTIDYGTVPRSHAVSTDWILGWWVDGKYLAVPLIAMFFLLTLRHAREWGGQLMLIVLVTSLVTDAVMLPITWLAIGLCLAGAPIASRTLRPNSKSRPDSLAPELATA